MNYHGYKIDNAYIAKDTGALQWQIVGNGSYVLGTKGAKRYFIKRNENVRRPTKDCGEALRKLNEETSRRLEEKQAKLKGIMAKFDVEKDGIVKEEEHFWDNDSNKFVTITKFIDNGLSSNYEFYNLPAHKKLNLIIQMLEILDKLHTVGIIHGDLKESNFVFREEGGQIKPYIIDFDASYTIDDAPINDDVPYSDGYESPEILANLNGNTTKITTATDIFTMGIIFNNIFAGEPIGYMSMSGGCYSSIAEALSADGKIVMPKGTNVSIGIKNINLKDVILWMLTKEPENRPRSIDVINLLKGKADLRPSIIKAPEYLMIGDLSQKHSSWAYIDKDELEKLGVELLRCIQIDGKITYELECKGKKRTIVSIDDLIALGYAKVKDVNICKPWLEHDIKFRSQDVLQKAGIIRIEQVINVRKDKVYKVLFRTGTSCLMSKQNLINENLVEVCDKVVLYNNNDGLWPEDMGIIADDSKLKELGVKSIQRYNAGGQHRYRVITNQKEMILSFKGLLIMRYAKAK